VTPLTWHSLFHTTEGIASFGTIALAAVTLILALGTLLVARGTNDNVAETRRLGESTNQTATETRNLAAATTRLAELTETEVKAVAEQAEAARQEVEVSRLALQANIKPRLLNVPWTRDGETRVKFEHPKLSSYTHPAPPDLTSTTIYVPLRNIGPGIAFIKDVTMYWNELGALRNPVPYLGTSAAKVLPAGETMIARFQFADPLNSARAVKISKDAKVFWVEVSYTDTADEQQERVRLTLGLNDRDEWVVTKVGYYQNDEPAPYVESEVQ
jgi:outer membrane murein-binding lipoprotein Lpp